MGVRSCAACAQCRDEGDTHQLLLRQRVLLHIRQRVLSRRTRGRQRRVRRVRPVTLQACCLLRTLRTSHSGLGADDDRRGLLDGGGLEMAGAQGARQCGIGTASNPATATSRVPAERAPPGACGSPDPRAAMAPAVSGLQPLGQEELAAARRAQAQQKRRNEALHRQVRLPLAACM